MSFENNVRKVTPYIPGEQPKDKHIIKLNTNECPYPPSANILQAVKDVDIESLRLYPDPEASALTNCLACYYGVEKGQVFVGVGSDDVLSVAFLTFFNSEKPIFFPDITYSFYEVWADVYRIPYEKKALDDNFNIKPEDYFTENGGIIFPNPNAPTGVFESIEVIEEIVKKNPNSIVIVDEAYVDFGAKSCLSLIKKYENVLVVQTFSKSRAMAGMRIGFAIGNKKLIAYMNDVKFSINSYTMNQPALAYGAAVVEDDAYFKEITGKIIKTRERIKQELVELGFSFPEAMGNFIFATHKTYAAKELFEMLKENGIYVRYFNKPRIDNYLRITIGTDEEMSALITCLKSYIKN